MDERQIQTGDVFQVTLPTGEDLYRVTAVSATQIDGYSIASPTFKTKVLMIDGQWKFEGTNKNVKFYALENFNLPFVNVPNADIQILMNLDGKTLGVVCQLNKYVNQLCQNDTLWQAMVKKEYFDDFNFKEDTETWKQYYKFLVEFQRLYSGETDHVYIAEKLLHENQFKLAGAYTDMHIMDISKLSPMINYAVKNGKMGILEWGERKGILPDYQAANYAISKNNLYLLDWLEKRHIFPNNVGANYAAKNGNITLLEHLSKSEIFPNEWGANFAAGKGYIEILDWIEEHKLPLPNQKGANKAAKNGHIRILEWMKRRVRPPVDEIGANGAAGKGHIEVLKWLANLDVFPDQDGANQAAERGSIEVLNWMEGHELSLPDQDGANEAAEGGSIEVLNWMEERKLPLPTRYGADSAANRRHFEILDWMKKRNISPSKIFIPK